MTVDELEEKKVASYLAMHLRGPAFDVWKGMKPGAKKDAAKIKETLRKTYGIRRSSAWRSMMTYRISAGQQLDSACEELYKLAQIVTSGTGSDPASTLTAVAFVEALPGHVAQRVRVLCGQTATKERVLEAAKDIWHVSDTDVTAAAVNPLQQPGLSTGASISKTRRGPTAGTAGSENRRCYGCGMVGHLRRNCRSVCAKCGGTRHSEHFCKSAGNELGEQ